MFEERDQRRGDGDELLRRHVHVVDMVRRHLGELALMANIHQVLGEAAVAVQGGVGLGDDELDLVRDPAVLDLAVRRLQEAVPIRAGVDRERVDEPDVRTLRCLDGADPAVVRRMHVAHLETGPLPGQTARAQRRHAAFVGDLGERIGLIHELRQLARPEELLDRRGHRLGVDHVLGHQPLGFSQRQPFLDRPLNADQADAELLLGHLADGLHTPVAEVVDVVHGPLAVADLDQRAQHVDDVLVGQRARTGDAVPAQAAVELHAPDAGQVVSFRGEEQVVEQVLRGFLGGRLARAHHAVDLHERLEPVAGDVDGQRVGDIRAAVEVIGVDGLDAPNPGFDELVQDLVGDAGVAGHQDLARLLVDDVAGNDPLEQVVPGDVQTPQARPLQ